MSRFDKHSFRCGMYAALFAWSVTEMAMGGDQRDWVFYINVVLTAAFGVLAVWHGREIRKQDSSASRASRAHIDTEGVYAALRCTGCTLHLTYLQHGDDLARLAAARDGHECAAKAEQEVQS